MTCFICLSVWDPWPLNFGAFLKLFRWPGHASSLLWLSIAFYTHSLSILYPVFLFLYFYCPLSLPRLPLIILVLATFSLPLLGCQPLPLCLPLSLCCCFCCCPPDQPVLLRMMIKTRQEKAIHENSFGWSAWCWPGGFEKWTKQHVYIVRRVAEWQGFLFHQAKQNLMQIKGYQTCRHRSCKWKTLYAPIIGLVPGIRNCWSNSWGKWLQIPAEFTAIWMAKKKKGSASHSNES